MAWTEKIDIEVKLNFYIKWIEQYELIRFINSVLSKYDKISKKVDNRLIVLGDKGYDENIKKADEHLEDIKKEMDDFKKQLNKKENLEKLYSKLMIHNKNIMAIEVYLDK